MLDRLEQVEARYLDIESSMADPAVATDPSKFRDLSREHSRLGPIVEAFRELRGISAELEDARAMLEEDDADVQELAKEEVASLTERRAGLDERLKVLLLPRDPDDEKDVVVEIRSAAGGDEAALFAADLFRMYARFAERRRWKIEILNSNATPGGGFKDIVMEVAGKDVFGLLKHEGGVHRVQRVPATEAQGRIHTSTATVAILPVAEEVELDIPANDVRVDVYRSSGPGGQSVNTTDSAVRLTHIPTGLVVMCQDEKSQHKNKARAMMVLRSRLLEQEKAARHAERSSARQSMVGSGDRSEKVRTYNFPQNRITDHRIGQSWHRLEGILDGDIGEVIEAVASAARADALQASD